jgi:hypothetical protein
MKKTSAASWCLGLFLVVGCGGGGGGGGGPISTQPLAGKIGGQAWTFMTGETIASLSNADELFVNLYPTSFETCVSFGAPTGVDNVIMIMPRAAGSYSLGLSLTATLYDASDNSNYATTNGSLVIDSVTATTISGGLRATYNGDNSVDGQFQAAICP